MNGKHPIDELFAGALRDAEATPPERVWTGIAQSRELRRRIAERNRRRWGLASVLLLLLGGASGWWWYAGTGSSAEVRVAATTTNEHPTATEPTQPGNAETTSTPAPSQNTPGTPVTASSSEGTGPSAVGVATPAEPSAASATRSTSPKGGGPGGAQASMSSPRAKEVSQPTTSANSAALNSTNHPVTTSPTPTSAGSASVPATNTSAEPEPQQPTAAQPAPEAPVQRSLPDEHLSVLSASVPLIERTEAPHPGGMLPGREVAPYVIQNGHWWFAAQFAYTPLGGRWTGKDEQLIAAMNQSETWKDRMSFSLVFGREWESGFGVGLSAGLSRTRSRFLHREVTDAQTTTTVDTVWTSAAMGAQTVYTWDIIEAQITEPGVDRSFNATNTLTQLRLAPEVSYAVWQRRRLSVHARVAPSLSLTLQRQGEGLLPATDEGGLPAIADLKDEAFDKRFGPQLALSLSMDVRYRLTPHLSIGVLPAWEQDLLGGDRDTPTLRTSGFGGALRLRFDMSHRERRTHTHTTGL